LVEAQEVAGAQEADSYLTKVAEEVEREEVVADMLKLHLQLFQILQ
jgi:hypothetical protein